MPPSRKTITIRGQRFRVERRAKVLVNSIEVDGSCDPPPVPTMARKQRFILIAEGLTPERELDVFIHEMLHAAVWDLDETAVAETATDIARALCQFYEFTKPKFPQGV
jgi:hypothetical protein